jgi:hypothetical protein
MGERTLGRREVLMGAGVGQLKESVAVLENTCGRHAGKEWQRRLGAKAIVLPCRRQPPEP